MSIETQIQQAADLIRQSRRLVVLTGSGVSKESGVPTFRDALDGLWAQYNPNELATQRAFRQNPKLVWDFYEHRRAVMRLAHPNAAHLALAALEAHKPDMVIITQNVDDLHEQAGSHHVIRLHGRINANRCSGNCQGSPTPVDVSALEWNAEAGPPACPHCGSPVRPDVVWFGELLPMDALEQAKDASAHADVMLVVGTSGVVMPAAEMPHIAKRAGAPVIEVNPTASEITPIADLWLAGAAGDVLPRVVALLDQ
jgi:NAD-dependent deacetylase